jgi:3',5'-cyclic AMP phosphodiesterase CpdA
MTSLRTAALTALLSAAPLWLAASGASLDQSSQPSAGVDYSKRRFSRAADGEFDGLDRTSDREWREPFFFIQLADTQYGLFTRNQGFDKEVELVRQAVEHINRLEPRFVIVCGDLVNANPGTPRYESQVAAFKEGFSRVAPTIPLVCVCGNHDVLDRPTPDSIAAYRENFGDDTFGFWAGGVRGLVLNSSLIKDPSAAPDALARQEQWLRAQLEDAAAGGARHILVFQHHPLFLVSPDEEDEYFNIPRARRMPVLPTLGDFGVRAVFAGHYHRNSYGVDGDLQMITTGAVGMPFGDDPSGLRIVKVFDDSIEHRYYAMDQVPETVSMQAAAASR